jgi:hypothetical protein
VNKSEYFSERCRRIRELDAAGYSIDSAEIFEAYMQRNMLGLDPNKKISRIFQTAYLEADIRAGVITLSRIVDGFWKDKLENPLAKVAVRDEVAGGTIEYGAVVKSLYGQCWTHRRRPTKSDWESFSHGNPASRITTTAKKLIERIADSIDSSYMHRTWLIEVEYLREDRIRSMQTAEGVIERLEPTGAALALSAATVRSTYIDEDEVRLLFDAAFFPLPPGVGAADSDPRLLQIPFDWDGVIEDREEWPATADEP